MLQLVCRWNGKVVFLSDLRIGQRKIRVGNEEDGKPEQNERMQGTRGTRGSGVMSIKRFAWQNHKTRLAQRNYNSAGSAGGGGGEHSSLPQEVAWEGGDKWRRSCPRPAGASGGGSSPSANLRLEAWEGEPAEVTGRR